jgi:sporulation protein YlmC with PRC-barrel domain
MTVTHRINTEAAFPPHPAVPYSGIPLNTSCRRIKMRKLSMLASVAVLGVAFAGPAVMAQTLTGSPTAVLADHSMRASKLIGMKVNNDQGQPIGTVEDVLVKDGAIEPRVILSVGAYVGGGDKLIAVPLSHVHVEGMKAMMPGVTKQAMATMPAFKFEGLNGGGG